MSTTQNTTIERRPCRAELDNILSAFAVELEQRVEDVSTNPSLSERWTQDLKNLCAKTCKPPSTVIAVVGSTGSGKSSLINAILDDRIVPTSGWKACTSMVTEISYRNSPGIFGEIEYLSRSEWLQEVEATLQDIDESENSDANLYTVYPTLKHRNLGYMNAETILNKFPDITDLLGTTRTLDSVTSDYFQQDLIPLVTNRIHGGGHGAKESQLWPLIRQLRIKCNASCLSDGVILVDLPGTADANQARGSIAEKYIQNCHFVWLIAPITRAVDDKVAQDLLGARFKTQLMYGRVRPESNQITLIATKSDDISLTELITDLDLDQDPWLVKTKESLAQLSKLKELKTKLRNARKAVQKLIEESAASPAKHKRKYDGHEDESDSDSDDEVVDNVTVPRSHDSMAEETLEKRISDGRRQIFELEFLLKVQSSLCEEGKSEKILRREIHTFVSKARSETTKARLQADFRAGIKQLDDAAAENSDPEIFDPAGNTRDYQSLMLPVFTCSSRDYMLITTGQTLDGKPTCFSNVEDTGIPEIRDWIGSLIKSSREQDLDASLTEARTLLKGIILFCQTSTGIQNSESEQMNLRMGWALAKVKLRSYANSLTRAFQPIIQETVSDFKGAFRGRLQVQARTGAFLAAQNALNIHNDLASQVTWQRYKALIRRHGAFRDNDLNANLTQPLAMYIASKWAKIFEQDHFGYLEVETIRATKRILKDMVQGMGKSSSPWFKDQIVKYSEASLIDAKVTIKRTVRTLRDKITQQQKTISREMAPNIKTKLQETYDSAKQEKGRGSTERQKNKIRMVIVAKKEDIFMNMGDVLIKSLSMVADEIEGELMGHFQEISHKVEHDLALLWEPQEISIDARIISHSRQILEQTCLRYISQIESSVIKSEEY